MTSIRIAGSGSFVPGRLVTNKDFEAIVDTSDEWITTRTGMKERYIATTEPTWYMGLKAAEHALRESGVKPEEVDMIVAATISSDYVTPSMACVIQEHLGARNSFCFDVNVACSGFAFLSDLVWRYMRGGGVQKALIIGAESLSQYTDYTDRSTCVLFGDGAGAMVLEQTQGIFGSFIHTDGTGARHIHAVRSRRETPFYNGPAADELSAFEPIGIDTMYMNGREVYKFAVKAMPEAIGKACEKAGIQVEELDLIIPHQANARIIETAAKNMGLPMDKMMVNIERYGNTSSATIPLAFHQAVEEGRLKRGDKICLTGFGAGLIYAAAVLEY